MRLDKLEPDVDRADHTAAAARAARELLAALDVAEARIRQSYAGTDTPVLLGRIALARKKLESLAR